MTGRDDKKLLDGVRVIYEGYLRGIWTDSGNCYNRFVSGKNFVGSDAGVVVLNKK